MPSPDRRPAPRRARRGVAVWRGRTSLGLAGIALSLLAAGPAAWALERGTTPSGAAYLSGGIGQTEQQAITQARPAFNLWLLTAARRSGAYLAAVRVRVSDGAGQVVFDRALDGPWLLLALAPGSYAVQAAYADAPGAPLQRQQATVRMAAQGHRQLVLYFDAADQAVPP